MPQAFPPLNKRTGCFGPPCAWSGIVPADHDEWLLSLSEFPLEIRKKVHSSPVLIRKAVIFCTTHQQLISPGSRRSICMAFLTLDARQAQPRRFSSQIKCNQAAQWGRNDEWGGVTSENTYLMTAYLNDIRGLERRMENKCKLGPWHIVLENNCSRERVSDEHYYFFSWKDAFGVICKD